MPIVLAAAVVAAALAAPAAADVFLHIPRGSNCRINEANANRNNGNRLFDSQNNAKGGYSVGAVPQSMAYYEGSVLDVEFTGTHGCGADGKTRCNVVIQYMCGYSEQSTAADPATQIRDGSSSDTIRDDQALYNERNPSTNEYEYGMHESFQYYQDCKTRNRNEGLWVADRNMVNPGRPATNTRQNNNGNRRGFECPEERDYYPYWHPTPWKDVAVLTDDVAADCSVYQAESQNVQAKNYCATGAAPGSPDAGPNNEAACTAPNVWQAVPAHGIPAPECVAAPSFRANDGMALQTYRWTLPTAAQEPCITGDDCVCVMRLRYNISTNETVPRAVPTLDSSDNGLNSPIQVEFERQGQAFSSYLLGIPTDTTQTGRVFQDRSHVFRIKPRGPAGIPPAANVFNLGVRGKRGNVVQTFPALEYDFAPRDLQVGLNDYVHFQWDGSNTNPSGNAGQGTAQTDRSNIVQVAGMNDILPASDQWLAANTPLFTDPALRLRFSHLNQTGCLTLGELQTRHGLDNNGIEQDPQNCMLLNAAPAYFDGGAVQMTNLGTFHFMSTRNNHFANRQQKATLTVGSATPPSSPTAGSTAGSTPGAPSEISAAAHLLTPTALIATAALVAVRPGGALALAAVSAALLVAVATIPAPATADVFLHIPRGSNGRLNEANANRNNGNRLFDSQNNAKGGYSVGAVPQSMAYYEGSVLDVEFTGTDGCGADGKTRCNLVIQYMCGSRTQTDGLVAVRDGESTNTAADDALSPNGPEAVGPSGNFTYGMHEAFQYYQDCKARNRNGGLWMADRNLEIPSLGTQATTTRQNNDAFRSGFECPEERDYYPYWHPTPWKDVAVLTDDVAADCSVYQAESQNVQAKNYCATGAAPGSPDAGPNNEAACTAPNVWQAVPAHGIPAPECVAAPSFRANTGTAVQTYRWTLPTAAQEPCITGDDCVCVMRLRYNASTPETVPRAVPTLDWRNNSVLSPLRQDSIVTVNGQPLFLPIDTIQTGTVFQDRSHVFRIKPRGPAGIPPTANVFNLGVRGKRGNVVQTFPALEYDFAPRDLQVGLNDYVHFQWDGSNTNPAGNAGEGQAQTDRSNIVQMAELTDFYPASDQWLAANTPLFPVLAVRTRFAGLGQTGCLTLAELQARHGNFNNNDIETDPQNCMKLNAAPAYFDGGAVQMTNLGTFHFMSTRNNNFSNRQHKGTLTVV